MLRNQQSENNNNNSTQLNSKNSSNSSDFKPLNFMLLDLKTNPYQTDKDYPYPGQNTPVVVPEIKNE